MQIDGYRIINRLRELENEKSVAETTFTDNLKKFPDEVRPDPLVAIAAFSEIDEKITRLQVLQVTYNQNVIVDVNGKKMNLIQAVKSLGGAGRLEKLWRFAVKGKRDRYALDQDVRDKDTVVAERTVPLDLASKKASEAAAQASALRAAIARGNAQEMTVSDDYLVLFT